jgi:hypothetical protein
MGCRHSGQGVHGIIRGVGEQPGRKRQQTEQCLKEAQDNMQDKGQKRGCALGKDIAHKKRDGFFRVRGHLASGGGKFDLVSRFGEDPQRCGLVHAFPDFFGRRTPVPDPSDERHPFREFQHLVFGQRPLGKLKHHRFDNIRQLVRRVSYLP